MSLPQRLVIFLFCIESLKNSICFGAGAFAAGKFTVYVNESKIGTTFREKLFAPLRPFGDLSGARTQRQTKDMVLGEYGWVLMIAFNQSSLLNPIN